MLHRCFGQRFRGDEPLIVAIMLGQPRRMRASRAGILFAAAVVLSIAFITKHFRRL